MLWKPAAVQLKNVKAKNCGSFFSARQVKESGALREAGGLHFIWTVSLFVDSLPKTNPAPQDILDINHLQLFCKNHQSPVCSFRAPP